MNDEITAKIIGCLGTVGFFAFSVGIIFFTVRVLRNFGVSWDITLALTGAIVLLLACLGAKLFSR